MTCADRGDPKGACTSIRYPSAAIIFGIQSCHRQDEMKQKVMISG
jgi:hypothetical protein